MFFSKRFFQNGLARALFNMVRFKNHGVVCSGLKTDNEKRFDLDRKEKEMLGFRCLRRRSGIVRKRIAVTCLVIVSMVFMGVVCGGCKKRQSSPVPSVTPELERVVTNRMNDVAYREALKKNRIQQGKQASELFEVRKQMRVCRERIQATLPTNTDAVALKEALNKDAEWRALETREKTLVEADKQTRAAARDLIRLRIEEEGRAVEAVAQGRARAVDAEAPRK